MLCVIRMIYTHTRAHTQTHIYIQIVMIEKYNKMIDEFWENEN